MTFDPDYVVAPGETLEEWFENMCLPLSIGRYYGLSGPQLRRLFEGRLKITPKVAQKLCNMTHVGAPFWLAAEHNFRVGLAAGKKWVGDAGAA